MAGRGQRFVDAGYETPKPYLPLNGRRMIEEVVANVTPARNHRLTLITSDDVTEVTEGAACTVLLKKDVFNNDEPLLLANSDQIIDANINDFIQDAIDRDLDGSIMVFPATEHKWSYAKVVDRKVVQVAEKKPISTMATVGIYYFKHGSDFVKAAEQMIEKNIRTNGEFYVCPVYNELIEMGKNIGVYMITAEQMHGLGTPEDYERYEG